ncbi:uncharacterized protein LOC129732532 [Wyeomyia smithii]|uniref:uncharacterized protein LOC129732532 n=1 Tax=Wyeomyia smithii TaxID=174621 RepID=UPI0024680337|nr:uncharacterized protein LOC129732532 [Wyeomyia smithii]
MTRNTFLSLSIILAIVVCEAHALTCTACDGKADCESGGRSVECTVARVANIHKLYSYVNPSLNAELPQDPEFTCFRMLMDYESPLTGSLISVVQRDCAIKQAKFCKYGNWVNSDFFACRSCTGDNCNAVRKT